MCIFIFIYIYTYTYACSERETERGRNRNSQHKISSTHRQHNGHTDNGQADNQTVAAGQDRVSCAFLPVPQTPTSRLHFVDCHCTFVYYLCVCVCVCFVCVCVCCMCVCVCL